ncbi:Ig-like domain-containing protein [Paenibacillus chungangensis]|uniref:Ig-like domain-containing protein n=1 Tax=Paenibacillus chungangensis TaxID=696535 RepID=A0ABW3HUW8_9BACL
MKKLVYNRSLTKFTALLLAIVLICGSVAFLQPLKANGAANSAEPLTLVSGTVNYGNTVVTLDFNASVSDSVYGIGGAYNGIEIKRTGAASYLPISSQGMVSFADGEIVLNLSSPLQGADNLIRVAAYSVAAGVDNPLKTTQTVTVAATAALNVVSTVSDSEGKTFTITFDQEVSSAVEDVKDSISINDDSLVDEDSIELIGDQLIIRLNTAMEGSFTIGISRGALVYGNELLNKGLYIDVDTDFSWYDAYFDNGEPIAFEFNDHVTSLVTLDELKNAIVVTRDGDAVPVGSVTIENDGDWTYLYVSVDNVDSGTYVVTIPEGLLRSSNGILNSEILETFSLDSQAPKLVSTDSVYDSETDRTTVTLTFDQLIYCNNHCSGNTYYWMYNFQYIRNNQNNWWETLNNASASINGNELIIVINSNVLDNGINELQLRISGSAIKSSSNNSLPEFYYPSIVEIADTRSPYFFNASMTNANRDVVFTFDEAISDNTEGQLKDSITYAIKNGSQQALGEDVSAAIEGNKLIVHFSEALDEQNYTFMLQAGTIKDMFGNVLNSDVNYYVSPGDITPPKLNWADVYPIAVLNAYAFELGFNETIRDNTVIDGVSMLKDYIEISYDGGVTFQSLGDDDWVNFYENNSYMQLIVHSAISERPVIKLKGGAIVDVHGNVTVEDQVIESYVDSDGIDMFGNFYSDADSSFTLFAPDTTWANKVYKVVVRLLSTNESSALTSDQYEVTNDKLIIKSGSNAIFENDQEYEIKVYAYGYDDAVEAEGTALPHSESFYMTAPTMNSNGGLTASTQLIANNNIDYPKATVVFQLMKGTMPVANTVVSAYMNDLVNVSANFNVSDPDNSNYSVRVFIIDGYDNGASSAGTQVGMTLTLAEFEQKLMGNYYGP